LADVVIDTPLPDPKSPGHTSLIIYGARSSRFEVFGVHVFEFDSNSPVGERDHSEAVSCL
jgi:hypothetical protein